MRGELEGAVEGIGEGRKGGYSLALGSKVWMEDVFERNREKMQVKREEGARKAKEQALRAWRGLLDLRGEG